ncbi:PREDICTED: trafficking protein particle complex subunit 1, partial [Corvus brachyrhynchos]|uniref:trafficking protein particle complex subunit 1 n=1 Tax=Corvus brachyrhynchos TaxID=85066 RepID=UPI0008167C8F
MTVHNLYIFDRGGQRLFSSEWHLPNSPNLPKFPTFRQEFKLMFGMLFSLRSFVAKMSPTDMRDGFVAFHTSKYRLHYLETPSGLRLVLNTDLGVPSAREALQHIYSNVSPKSPKSAPKYPKSRPRNTPKSRPQNPRTEPRNPPRKNPKIRPEKTPNPGPKKPQIPAPKNPNPGPKIPAQNPEIRPEKTPKSR